MIPFCVHLSMNPYPTVQNNSVVMMGVLMSPQYPGLSY